MSRGCAFVDALAAGTVVLDGGLATELETYGHDLRDRLWSARLVRDEPAAVVAAHRAFFTAGARVATTASYQASYAGFRAAGLPDEDAADVLVRSVALAREAQPAGRETFVAGSIGPYGVVWADGSEFTGDYTDATDDDIASEHRRRIETLVGAGPDLLAVETIPNGREAEILGEVLSEAECPVWVTFCCRDAARLSDGTPIEIAIRAVTRHGVPVAVGVNCLPPEHVLGLIERARRVTDLPLVAYPNWGRVWDGAAREWLGARVGSFPASVLDGWRKAGAVAIGGCCGIGPEVIAGVAAWAGDAAGGWTLRRAATSPGTGRRPPTRPL